MRYAAPYSSTDSAKSVTSYENQRHRACGLNPLVAAIILWNKPTFSELSITCASKGTIRHPVICLIGRHSAGSISI
jgi:hypothetical protein